MAEITTYQSFEIAMNAIKDYADEAVENSVLRGFLLKDQSTGRIYGLQAYDGAVDIHLIANSISYRQDTTIEIFEEGGIDFQQITVYKTLDDGSETVILDIDNLSTVSVSGNTATIMYVDCGKRLYTTVPVTVKQFNAATDLIDFDYTANSDGTYTITGWKGTYKGQTSTKIVVPNSPKVKI